MLIQQEGELCVCEIMHALAESQPKISRHLAYMRRAGVVSSRRDGTWMHYRINTDMPSWAKHILASVYTNLTEQTPFKKDRKRLTAMNNRPGIKCA